MVAVLAGGAGATAGEPAHPVYRFGVVPQFDARHAASVWEPILAELARRSGERFVLVGSARNPEFEAEFAGGRFDFAYMSPYHVLRAAATQGYVPLVRDRTPLHGVLVVRRDSPIQAPSELHDQVVAVPSPNAMAASLLLRAELAQQFGVRFKPRDVQTHSSVYLNVARGRVAAGGGAQQTLDEQPPAVRERLRVLHTTRAVPAHPLVAHPRVPVAVRARVRQALLEMNAVPAGRVLLAGVPMTEVVPAALADYRPVAALHLEKYAVPE
jgi:phosphonate transport system substrate-binding protein